MRRAALVAARAATRTPPRRLQHAAAEAEARAADVAAALAETRSALADVEAQMVQASESGALQLILRALLLLCTLAMAVTLCSIKRSNGYSNVKGIVLVHSGEGAQEQAQMHAALKRD